MGWSLVLDVLLVLVFIGAAVCRSPAR